MSRNQELIEKYEGRIGRLEREIQLLSEGMFGKMYELEAKISVYKMVIIDLQE